MSVFLFLLAMFNPEICTPILFTTGFSNLFQSFSTLLIFSLLIAIIFLLLFKYILLKKNIADTLQEVQTYHKNEQIQLREQFYLSMNKDFKIPLSNLLHSLEQYYDKERDKEKKETIKECIRNVRLIQHKLILWPNTDNVQEDKIILEKLKQEISLYAEEKYPVPEAPSVKTVLGNTDTIEGLELVEDMLERHIASDSPSIQLTSSDEKLLKNVISYIRSNLENTELTVEGMSKKLGLSRNHLHRKLKALTGQSPVEFIKTIRMSYAVHFLKSGKWSVSEVGYKVGYNTPSYFSTSFTAHYGMSPTAYLEKETSQLPKEETEIKERN